MNTTLQERQEVFDKVATHLIKQDQKSQTAGLCLLRKNLNGKILKCALGCLISDEAYYFALEREYLLSISHRKVLEQSKVPGIVESVKKSCPEMWSLLHELIQIHDQSSPSRWKDNLQRVAEMFKLSSEAIL
jgi:hypothetical protein